MGDRAGLRESRPQQQEEEEEEDEEVEEEEELGVVSGAVASPQSALCAPLLRRSRRRCSRPRSSAPKPSTVRHGSRRLHQIHQISAFLPQLHLLGKIRAQVFHVAC